MAPDLTHALRGAAGQAPRLPALDSVLVIGGGGALGSAILAEALVAGRFQRVSALVDGPLASALRGFHPLGSDVLARPAPLPAQTAFVVFERERHSNGRDDAFHRPDPGALPALAARLRAGGVRRLLVVVPHAPALLPRSLMSGFASEAEAAVGALGFEHLVFVRAARHAEASGHGSPLQRFAAWWLSQLRWMVPQREQALRAVALAACVVQLARRLPLAPSASRVLPPEVLWEAAQAASADFVLDAWLAQTAPG